MKELSIANSGGTQSFEFHTSCSQPLAVGDQAGALLLVAFDEDRGSTVRYIYTVANSGPDDALVTSIVDDQLGSIATNELPSPVSPGTSVEFSVDVVLDKATTNIATVTGESDSGKACETEGPSNKVVVNVVPDPCGSGKKSGGKKSGCSGKGKGKGGSSRRRRKK